MIVPGLLSMIRIDEWFVVVGEELGSVNMYVGETKSVKRGT